MTGSGSVLSDVFPTFSVLPDEYAQRAVGGIEAEFDRCYVFTGDSKDYIKTAEVHKGLKDALGSAAPNGLSAVARGIVEARGGTHAASHTKARTSAYVGVRYKKDHDETKAETSQAAGEAPAGSAAAAPDAADYHPAPVLWLLEGSNDKAEGNGDKVEGSDKAKSNGEKADGNNGGKA